MKNKKTLLIGIGAFIAICLIIGISYAVWRITVSQTDTNRITADCFEITLTNEKDMISLENAFPLYDEEGMKLTPYTFTIQNKCASYASYNINLELLDTVVEESRLDPKYLKVVLDENTPTILSSNSSVEPTLSNAYASYELTTGYLEQNEEKTYNLRLWLDENVTLQDPVVGKSIIAKITVTANYIDHIPTDYDKCVAEYGEDSIQCNIIANVDTTGKCPEVLEDGRISTNDAEDIESLICSAPDDYGTSYYFRGDVQNNWVKFADTYWRIVRVNGDGSIRVVYAGDANTIDSSGQKETILQNGYNDSSTGYTQIGRSAFNENYNDNAYVGYMYGTPGSSSYEETHANINDSTIKQYIDQWYKTNIVDKGYIEYVSDTLFCNDRSFVYDEAFSINGFYNGNTMTQLGYGQNYTAYRWSGDPQAAQMGGEFEKVLTYPTFQCSNQNDRFTVSSGIGNSDLTYPVALLSTDDIYAAGGFSAENYNYYLYTGNAYFALSPYYFYDGYAYVRYVTSDGRAGLSDNVNGSRGVRPVINLKPNSLKQGDGTALNPYQVEELT